jgi:3-oxoadipate enol-lactonase
VLPLLLRRPAVPRVRAALHPLCIAIRGSLSPSVPFVQSDDVRIYYEAHGKGPALLLVPGIPAISSDWFPFADGLSERFRVVVYDNRGSGRSDAPPGPYSTRKLAGDAVAVLDTLEIERAHVFGVSLGGMIAQELAIGFPKRLDRLVLGCTQASTRAAVRPGREVSLAFAFETDDWAERMRVLAPFAFAPDVDAQLLASFIDKKSVDVQPEHGYRGQIGAVLGHDALDRLGSIERPTLVVTGAEDAVIPAENSETLRERIPRARLEVIEGAGHLFFIEQPERTLAVLETFLRD